MAAKMAAKYKNNDISGHRPKRTKNEGSSFTYMKSINRMMSHIILYHSQNSRWSPKWSQKCIRIDISGDRLARTEFKLSEFAFL